MTYVAPEEPSEQKPRLSGRRVPRVGRPVRRVLVVYWWNDRCEMRLAVEQHLHTLDRGSDEVVYVNAFRPQPRWLRYELFDAIVLHPTFLCLRWDRKFERERRAWAWIGKLDCSKVAVPQDEYNHAHVLDEWLTELGVDHVFSSFDEPTRQPLYPRLSQRARFSVALTGYIDEETAAYCRAHGRPLGERPFDVVYRAAHRRFWLGSHGLLKQEIGNAVLERAAAHGLAVDISTRRKDTIWGRAWLDFLLSGRAIVGVESGSSVFDQRGEIRARIDELLSADPSLTFDQVDAAMPRGWDAYAFFAIGPRHLEAVVARTAQVLVEGTYSGVLEPERHYIPVKRDFSNLDEALERLHDVQYLEELTSCAYEEIYLPGTWTIREFGDQLREAFGTPRRPSPGRRVRSTLGPATIATLRGLASAASGLHERGVGSQRRLSALLSRLRQVAVRAHAGSRRLLRRMRTRARALRVGGGSVVRRPRLAWLIAKAIARGDSRVVNRALLRDLLRLGLLDVFQHHQRAQEGPWRISPEWRGDALVLRSRCNGMTPASNPAGQVRRVVWEHSPVAPTALLDPGRPQLGAVRLGDEGDYEFTGLCGLVLRNPTLSWDRIIAGKR